MSTYSFFPWMGGKSRQIPRLLALIPKHTCYVEVFSGAANLLFAKSKARAEVLNDINAELVTLFRVVKYHRRELLRQLQFMLHSRTDFSDLKSNPGLTDIQRAARTYFLLKSCFGAKSDLADQNFGYGTTGRARFNRSTFSAIHRCHKRLSGVTIEQLDFAECIQRYNRPHTFFYCDPPYWKTAGYKDEFPWSDHQRLAQALKRIKGKFLLSINDHPDIRKLYKSLVVRKLQVKYSVSRIKQKRATDRQELLIANYPLPRKI